MWEYLVLTAAFDEENLQKLSLSMILVSFIMVAASEGEYF